MTDRTNAGVRNLRAMFESQNAASPEPRGRSPAGNEGSPSRPTSKVRASFVSVVPTQPALKDLGTTKGISVNSPQAHRRESFSVSDDLGAGAPAELKKVLSEEKEEREKTASIVEAVPEQAVETRESSRAPPPIHKAPEAMPNLGLIMKGSDFPEEVGAEKPAEKPAEQVEEKPAEQVEEKPAEQVEEKPTTPPPTDAPSDNPDKPVSGAQEEASLKPADPTDVATVAGGQALPPPTEDLATSGASKTEADTPEAAAGEPKANGASTVPAKAASKKPTAISVTKAAAAKPSSAKSPMPHSPGAVRLPKTPITPKPGTAASASAAKSPAPAKAQTKPAAKAPVSVSADAPKAARKSLRGSTPQPATAPTASAASKAKAPETEAKKPVASKPLVSKPTTSKPTSSKPATSKPVTSKPAINKPAPSKPASSKPATGEPDSSKATTTASSSKQSTTTSPGGFKKPKPRSPTRPIRLPSHLTAPTASSAAKHGEEAAAEKITRKPSTTTRPAPKAAPVAKKPASRASLAGGTTTTKRPESRASTVGGAGEGFLARMMRPTTSSASKTAEKPHSPPRKSTGSRAPVKPKAHESVVVKGKKKVEQAAEKVKDVVTSGHDEGKTSEGAVEGAAHTNGHEEKPASAESAEAPPNEPASPPNEPVTVGGAVKEPEPVPSEVPVEAVDSSTAELQTPPNLEGQTVG